MKKEDVIKIFDAELENAKECLKYHTLSGNQYGFADYFRGQKEIIKRLKRKINKLEKRVK